MNNHSPTRSPIKDSPIKAFGQTLVRFAIAATAAVTARATTPTIGLPVTRTYSIEEIGVSRGPHLNFDHMGRLAVISGINYVVLNDSDWIDQADKFVGAPALQEVANIDGQYYFGALASWGKAPLSDQGNIHPTSLRPETYPAWINATNFTEITHTENHILFTGTNGIVSIDRDTGEQTFFDRSVSSLFSLHGELFLSSGSGGTIRFEPETGKIEPVIPELAIHAFAHLGDDEIVGATTGRGLVRFDGTAFQPFDLGLLDQQIIRISCLETLPDGGFAVAVDGVGLLLFSKNGERRLALTTPDYRRIYDLASREPGILWLAKESSVQKLLYNNPVSVVDHRADVIIGWPQVVRWGDKTVIASNGRLYDMIPSADSWQYRFEEVENPPLAGAWSIAGNNSHLLVGNSDGVFVRHGQTFRQIPDVGEANRLFLQEENLCIVVGSSEISAIRWDGSAWRKCAPSIPGVGFPSVMHRADDSIWIELGLNRVARVWFENGNLQLLDYNEFPWDEPVWVNVGLLQDLVVLSGAHNQRLYLDRKTLDPVPAPPALEETLANVPHTILRLAEDHNHVIWVTHPNGVFTIHPDGQAYRIDDESLVNIRDQYPVITLIEREQAWISTESALYHVDQEYQTPPPHALQPFLVSVTDGRTGKQLRPTAERPAPLSDLPYSQNHLVFRYFAGGYTPLLAPRYEFSMRTGSNAWKVESPDSQLTLPSLEEGDYLLTAQLYDGARPIGQPILTAFAIAPPWYRSTIAYALYGAIFLLVGILILEWSLRSAKRKHDYLEKLVRERTDELRATMEKLTEEARNSATLAERNRLAGEIHDSLQQGLSGLALQLDATLKQSNLDPDLLSRLSVARRMVSFTRQEVQQAVWDLESPLLENDDLAEGLRNMASLLSNGSIELSVHSSGSPVDFPTRAKHHILRIAQEAITNAVRHSGAKRIQAELQFAPDSLSLEVADDGHGFDPHEIISNGIGHFGLRGLRNRSYKVNGDLRIESAPGSGTRILLTVPIPITSSDESDDRHKN